MAVRERMDMRVAGDQARRWNLPPEPQMDRISPAWRQRDALGADAVFKTARSIEFEDSRGQSDARRAVGRVHDAGPDSKGGRRVFHVKREQRTVLRRDGKAAGQRLLSLVVNDANVQCGLVQRLPGWALVQNKLAHLNVVAFLRWDDRKCVCAIAQPAGR